ESRLISRTIAGGDVTSPYTGSASPLIWRTNPLGDAIANERGPRSSGPFSFVPTARMRNRRVGPAGHTPAGTAERSDAGPDGVSRAAANHPVGCHTYSKEPGH